MIRAGVIASAAAGTILVASALTARGGERGVACPSSLVPAYLRPQGILDLVDGARLPRLLVVNPGSGPGAEREPDYRRAIAAAQAGGARVLGYVPTTWGARPRAAVDADAQRYREWYGTDGIFLDEAASSRAELAYYRDLSRGLRDAGAGLVVLNPGVVPARGYFGVADVVVTFEGPFSAYREQLGRMPAWLDEVAPEQIAHLVYAASREQALGAMKPGPHVGYFYVTSGTLPHPWGTAPEFLPAELAAIGGCR